MEDSENVWFSWVCWQSWGRGYLPIGFSKKLGPDSGELDGFCSYSDPLSVHLPVSVDQRFFALILMKVKKPLALLCVTWKPWDSVLVGRLVSHGKTDVPGFPVLWLHPVLLRPSAGQGHWGWRSGSVYSDSKLKPEVSWLLTSSEIRHFSFGFSAQHSSLGLSKAVHVPISWSLWWQSLHGE